MDKLEKKYDYLSKAIISFEQALNQREKWIKEINPELVEPLNIDYQGIILNLRDSAIQRFEYSTDLLWKYLKTYLDQKLNIVPDILSPNNVIRESCKARLLTEKETETMLEMIKNRNMTSHIYQEEIAQLLLQNLPAYLGTMKIILSKVNPNND